MEGGVHAGEQELGVFGCCCGRVTCTVICVLICMV